MTLKEKLVICSDFFYEIEAYRCTDEELTWLFGIYPQNKEFNEIFCKVVVLNSLYFTKILDTYKMSKYILSKNIDDKLNRGDLTVVDDIRTGHHIGKGSGRNFYSFATKYAHWHNPEAFSVYDSFVKKLLWDLNKTENFHDKFTQVSTERDYTLYNQIIDSFLTQFQFDGFKYRKIDKALWIYAKYRDEKSNFDDNTRRELKQRLKE